MYFGKKVLAVVGAVLVLLAQSGFALDGEVGIIFSSPNDQYKKAIEGCKQYLKSQQFTGMVTEYVLATTAPDEVMKQVAAKKTKCIIALGPEAARLVRDKADGVPAVVSMVVNLNDYRASGITGVSIEVTPEVKMKQFGAMCTGVKTIGVLYSEQGRAGYEAMIEAGKTIGATIVGVKVENDQEINTTLPSLLSQVDVFFFTLDKLYSLQSVKLVLHESMKNKKPSIGLSHFYTKAGAMVSFDCDYADIGAQAGEMAGKILNGTAVSSIMPQSPRKVVYSLSMATARTIGCNIPTKVVDEAVEVIW